MRFSLAAILVAVVIAPCGCDGPATLAGPPPGYRHSLVGFLQHATLDPAPASAPVIALIHTLGAGSNAAAPLRTLEDTPVTRGAG